MKRRRFPTTTDNYQPGVAKRSKKGLRSFSEESSSEAAGFDGYDDPGPAPKPLSGNKKGSFEHRFERRRYLNQLVQEFQLTTKMECKEQVLANLANFAYDPYNYHFFQEIGVLPVFLAELEVNRSQKFVEFAMAGICNCSPDKRMQREILRNDKDLKILKKFVTSSSVDILLSLMTTLLSFAHGNSELKGVILADNFTEGLSAVLSRHGDDKRLQNVVSVLQEELQLNRQT